MGTRGNPKNKRSIFWLYGAIIWYGWNYLNGPGIHFVHAGPRGGILGVRSTRWYNINGILIRTRNTQTFLHFRRLPRYMRKNKKR